MRPTQPDLPHAALLVIDMQEYFRGIASPVLGRVGELIRQLRTAGIPIIYTQHGHEDPARDGGMLYQWWDELIMVGGPEWTLLPELAPAAEDRIFAKTRYSAFVGTGLHEHLRQTGITDVVIAGVMTNLCCETTARDAFVRDYRVFFLTDGTATASPAHHAASLDNLGYGFATLLTCAELARLVRSAADRRKPGRSKRL